MFLEDGSMFLTTGPSRRSRSAEMRAKTCCTVSLKGGTVLLRRSHSRTRCARQANAVSERTDYTAT